MIDYALLKQVIAKYKVTNVTRDVAKDIANAYKAAYKAPKFCHKFEEYKFSQLIAELLVDGLVADDFEELRKNIANAKNALELFKKLDPSGKKLKPQIVIR